jgi:hypothetical protein
VLTFVSDENCQVLLLQVPEQESNYPCFWHSCQAELDPWVEEDLTWSLSSVLAPVESYVIFNAESFFWLCAHLLTTVPMKEYNHHHMDSDKWRNFSFNNHFICPWREEGLQSAGLKHCAGPSWRFPFNPALLLMYLSGTPMFYISFPHLLKQL